MDVNRNFVDYAHSLPPTSTIYAALADSFTPKTLSRAAAIGSWTKMLWFARKNGVPAFLQALAGGQYDHPDGLYFGGTEPSHSRTVWDEILAKHVLDHSPRDITHVDLHTGSGAYGEFQVLANTPAVEHHLRARLADQPVALTDVGLAHISGDIVDYWEQVQTPSGATIAPMTVEIGTSSHGIDTFAAMRNRATLFNRYADDHPKRGRITKAIQRAFFPRAPQWRANALADGAKFWADLTGAPKP